MDIIDAHLHLPAPWTPWEHGEESFLDLQAELLLAQMDAAGVDAAVLISGPLFAPAGWCRAVVARYPQRLAVVLPLDETAPDIAEQVQAVRDTPGVPGIRITTAFPPENAGRLRAGAYDALFDAADKYGVPVGVLGAGTLPDLAAVARARPGLALVVDHLGLDQPPYLPVSDSPWRGLDQLVALAEFPNVTVKLSGAPTLSAEPYPYPDVWPHLRRVLDAFGADRCMWATDQHRVSGRLLGFDPLPRHPAYHSYAQGLHYLLDRTDLSTAEKVALFGGTTRRILGWPTE
ncbi:amidohydrolase family protein [Winogradskya humida]|uniref:amidohydrolase family protein n=1 Tax=Winogradskya humida TaxID=113566 RepID=UPI001942098E|nr:amidohydrolase family protein [Actinoplanes humidus]